MEENPISNENHQQDITKKNNDTDKEVIIFTSENNHLPQSQKEKVLKTTKRKKTTNSLKKNIIKFFTDISVVVIGIMLSLWLNDMISNYNQQKEVKTFLLGLKKDFERDISEAENDMLGYKKHGMTFKYLATLKKNEKASEDSIKKYQNNFFNNVILLINDGRYEGFKSSGKLGNITDYELQNDIVNFYQEDIKALLMNTNAYLHTKQNFINYINENRIRTTDSTSNLVELLSSDKTFFFARKLEFVDEILENYNFCIKKMKKIIKKIKEKYKE